MSIQMPYNLSNGPLCPYYWIKSSVISVKYFIYFNFFWIFDRERRNRTCLHSHHIRVSFLFCKVNAKVQCESLILISIHSQRIPINQQAYFLLLLVSYKYSFNTLWLYEHKIVRSCAINCLKPLICYALFFLLLHSSRLFNSLLKFIQNVLKFVVLSLINTKKKRISHSLTNYK